MQTIELAEQIGGRVRNWAEGVRRVRHFPRLKRPMRLVELQVVHLTVSRFERRRNSNVRPGAGAGGYQCREYQSLHGASILFRLYYVSRRELEIGGRAVIRRPGNPQMKEFPEWEPFRSPRA